MQVEAMRSIWKVVGEVEKGEETANRDLRICNF
jgi:hypothetical protein